MAAAAGEPSLFQQIIGIIGDITGVAGGMDTARLNSAPVVYEQNEFNQLIEDLQDMIKILNSTYPKDQSDERERQVWFLGG